MHGDETCRLPEFISWFRSGWQPPRTPHPPSARFPTRICLRLNKIKLQQLLVDCKDHFIHFCAILRYLLSSDVYFWVMCVDWYEWEPLRGRLWELKSKGKDNSIIPNLGTAAAYCTFYEFTMVVVNWASRLREGLYNLKCSEIYRSGL